MQNDSRVFNTVRVGCGVRLFLSNKHSVVESESDHPVIIPGTFLFRVRSMERQAQHHWKL